MFFISSPIFVFSISFSVKLSSPRHQRRTDWPISRNLHRSGESTEKRIGDQLTGSMPRALGGVPGGSGGFTDGVISHESLTLKLVHCGPVLRARHVLVKPPCVAAQG